MSRGAVIGILVVIAIVAGVALWWWPQRDTIPLPLATSTTETLQTYTNSEYGYSFTRPSSLEVEEYTAQYVSIGIPNSAGGFDSVVDVSLFGSGDEGGYESFDEYVFERGRIICAADGPTGSLHCDTIESRQPFTTRTGVRGQEVFFTLVEEDFEENASTTRAFGPVFVFDMATSSPDDEYAALFVYQPLPSFLEASNETRTRAVAESVSVR